MESGPGSLHLDGEQAPVCDTDAYACFLYAGDRLNGVTPKGAVQTAGAVCMKLIFTGNFCCGVKDGVYGRWTE